MYTWALFKDCKVTEIIFGSKSQLYYFQLITKKNAGWPIIHPPNRIIHPKKKAPHVRGLSILDQDPQTLISTSTPLGSSIFIKASTVLEELE